MKDINLFDYPKYLCIIFDKLNKNGIKPIIVGGYLRDFFLNISSKDIDIELYGVISFEQLETILTEFGSLNNVGKSFGVCKLSLEDCEIDFTLPRVDNKISSGHSGFSVNIQNDLDFKSASSRRDFTINSMGYDVINKQLLDPFHGLNELQNKILKAVDSTTFSQDPLRVYRAVGFASRLNFTIDTELFSLCKSMCEKNILNELPKERIKEELKKILLKSVRPSIAFHLLKELKGLKYLAPLNKLSDADFIATLKTLDRITKLKTTNNKTNILLALSILCYKFTKEETELFISNITNSTTLNKNIFTLTKNKFLHSYNNSELLLLATQVNIEHFLIFSQAIHDSINKKVFGGIKKQAIDLNVLNNKEKAFLQGRDILAHGINPSPKYAEILSKAYQAQINLEIRSHEDAKVWLQMYLST